MDITQVLDFRAAVGRNDIAVISENRSMTYTTLHSHVRSIAARLRELGIQPGHTVAVYINSQYLHMCTVFALMHEGVASVSGHLSYAQLPASITIDAYITDKVTPFMTGTPILEADPSWLANRHTGADTIKPIGFEDPSSTCRIFTSSGTTGEAKAIPISIEKVTFRALRNGAFLPPSGPTMSMLGMATALGFEQTLRAVYSGRPLVLALRDIVSAINTYGVAELMASPAHIESLIKSVAPNGVRLPSLNVVHCGGASMSRQFLQRARAFVCHSFYGAYGSSEGGRTTSASSLMVASVDGCVGRPIPGSEVEIVDEEDRILDFNQEGVVRIRSLGAAECYLADEEATAEAFRHGCFYPGDLGYFTENGLLVITGRVTERINSGGAKINPVLIDEFLANQNGVRDAAAFGMEDRSGLTRVWAAVVPVGVFDEEGLARACHNEFRAKAPVKIIQVDEIPRNEMGKIVRRLLADKAMEALRSQ